jgi:hypothetical protein
MKRAAFLIISIFSILRVATASPFHSLKRSPLDYSILLQKNSHVVLFEPSKLSSKFSLKKGVFRRGSFYHPLSLFQRVFLWGKTFYSRNSSSKFKSTRKESALGVYYPLDSKFLLNGKYVVLNTKRVGNIYQEMNFPLLRAEYWFNARTRISISYKNVQTGPGDYSGPQQHTTAKLRINF